MLLCTPSRSFASVSAAAFGGAGLDGEPEEDLMGFGIGARAGMHFSSEMEGTNRGRDVRTLTRLPRLDRATQVPLLFGAALGELSGDLQIPFGLGQLLGSLNRGQSPAALCAKQLPRAIGGR